MLIDASCVVDDIEVVFYKIDPYTGRKSWEAKGIFAPTDVHRQVQFFGKIIIQNQYLSLLLNLDKTKDRLIYLLYLN